MNDSTTVYQARRILTMDAATPEATHVAVGGGRIVAVGGAELAQRYGNGDGNVDPLFADMVLTPGFVEGHAHSMEGMIWKLPYIGFHARIHPDGHRVDGCATVAALVQRLRELESALPADATLFAWGYDPIYFPDKPMRGDLDAVSAARPVVLFHSNLHLITVNSAALNAAGIHRGNVIDGVYVDADGEPNGELAEFAAVFPVLRAVGDPVFHGQDDPEGLRRFGRSCWRAGITTTADLYNALEPPVVDMFAAVTAEADFPARIVPALSTLNLSPAEVIARSEALPARNHDKLHFGAVKIITDGSIQGYSARVRRPYINGVENGVWCDAPAKLQAMMRETHAAGVKLHIHVNGDQASELTLDALEDAIAKHGALARGRRHVLQHAQMMDAAQLQRAAGLGLLVNLFANHTYYWGDQHRDATVGPDLAPRMNAARTALDAGLDIAIHCDAPVTPMGPLFTAWCAVNRRTASGREHGIDECITAAEALRAITLGPANTLDLDDRIGSIAPGKFADFTALDDDPLRVPPMRIRDIKVRGTMLGGRWQGA
ncbi:MAG: amidohydrolase [Gammaproteobacteria bacterium]|nr:amidohydrolase [Gammaproteobacteria bacterium]